MDAIAFNADIDAWLAAPATNIECVYRPAANEFRGERNLQLIIDTFWPV